jgi:hypothetical protein
LLLRNRYPKAPLKLGDEQSIRSRKTNFGSGLLGVTLREFIPLAPESIALAEIQLGFTEQQKTPDNRTLDKLEVSLSQKSLSK